MKLGKRFLLTAGAIALLLIAWVIVLSAKSGSEKQMELMTQADAYMADKIYILAVPLLEEASGYRGKHTMDVESRLKTAYLALQDKSGFPRKYTDLLEKQMRRKGASPDIFSEAANYYLEKHKTNDALSVLRNGIQKTADDGLVSLYEQERYAYQFERDIYQNVSAIQQGYIAVQLEDRWGLATSNGTPVIPCMYEKISSFSSDRVIVQSNHEIFAVDRNNNRLALLKEPITDFGNYAEDRISLATSEGWKRASGTFEIGTSVFEAIGTYSNGYVAVKQGGKWGVIDLTSKELLPITYDEIKMDKLGRCHAQKAVFAQSGNEVSLFVDGKQVGEVYEDAKPFGTTGYAAVKKDGKWGYIDVNGELKIDYLFEDALSFGQHLAAFKEDDRWGYVSLTGEVAIQPTFLEAGSFSNGSAPVLTERGWQFISLLEYQKGASL